MFVKVAKFGEHCLRDFLSSTPHSVKTQESLITQFVLELQDRISSLLQSLVWKWLISFLIKKYPQVIAVIFVLFYVLKILRNIFCFFLSFFLFFFPSVFCLFLGPHPRHMKVPRLGVQSELQPPAYRTASATRAASDVHHSSGNAWSLTHWGQGSNPQPHGS